MLITIEILKLHGFEQIGSLCYRNGNVTIFKMPCGYDVQVNGDYLCNISLEKELIEIKSLI